MVASCCILTVSPPEAYGGNPTVEADSDTAVFRDPFKWPFSKTSIWNMPIGCGARYVDAGITPQTARGTFAYHDIIILTPDEPLLDVYAFPGGWGSDRCLKGAYLGQLPIPSDFYLPYTGKTADHPAAILEQDHRTLNQSQPVHRCPENEFFTSKYWGYPDVDIYGEGIQGAHGGSVLSSIGGTIRLGEFTAGRIPHALKVCMYAGKYYFYDPDTDSTPGFRWPASRADGYASEESYGGTNQVLEIGSLLALQPGFDTSLLSTVPGKIIAQAFIDYGGYIVDDAAWDVFKIPFELGPEGNVEDEFRALYGFDFDQKSLSHPFSQDITTIFTHLFVIDNNGPDSIGGGGEPRIPLAPDFLPSDDVTVTTDGTPGAGVILPGTFPIHQGRVTRLTAVEPVGYRFTRWEVPEGRATLEDSTVRVTTLSIDSGDVTVRAHFIQEYYSLEVGVSGEGNVTVDPFPDSIPSNETITLTAVPADGWEFTGWEGDATGDDNPLNLSVTSDMNVFAHFAIPHYSLVAGIGGEGSVLMEPAGDSLPSGTVVTVTAIPDTGWIFRNWTGDLTSVENPLTLDMDRDWILYAAFDKLSTSSVGSSVPKLTGFPVIRLLKGNGIRSLEVSMKGLSPPQSVWICDLLGREIYREKVMYRERLQIPLEGIAPGIYIVQVLNGPEEHPASLKFVVP